MGNRSPDVCSLCDRPIAGTPDHGFGGMHSYVGPGWVHGGGRERIPAHIACLDAGDSRDTWLRRTAIDYIRTHFEPGAH